MRTYVVREGTSLGMHNKTTYTNRIIENRIIFEKQDILVQDENHYEFLYNGIECYVHRNDVDLI